MRPSKLFAALAVVVVGASVIAAGPLAVPAVALAARVPPINCQSVQSESDSFSAPVVVSGCNRRPLTTGGSGTFSLLGSGPYPITWSTGRETTIQCAGTCGFPPSGFRTPSRCTNPLTTEYDWVGSVATITFGVWTKRFIGDTVTFDACFTSSLAIDGLVPGTLFTITGP